MSYRPCACDRCVIGGPQTPACCSFCWKYHNLPEYKKLWDTGEGLKFHKPGPPPPEPPPLAQKVSNFQDALERWNAAGRPLVSAEVLAERRAACAACEFRNVDNDSCGVCGCPLSQPPLLGQALAVLTTGRTTASKTEMATERCPLGETERQEPYRSMEPRWLEAREARP